MPTQLPKRWLKQGKSLRWCPTFPHSYAPEHDQSAAITRDVMGARVDSYNVSKYTGDPDFVPVDGPITARWTTGASSSFSGYSVDVDPKRPEYESMDEAKAACQKHYDTKIKPLHPTQK